jgi:oligoribonuclease (3'-5' exoribonuclease)
VKKLCPNCEELLRPTGNPEVGQCSGCGWSGHYWRAARELALPATPPKMPYVSIDIETTGLDPATCQTLEVGAVIDDWKTPLDQLQRFRRVLTYETVTGSPYAMALNASLLNQIANPPQTCEFCKSEELGVQLAQWVKANGLDPMHLQAAGKNFASFDMQFLYRLPGFTSVVKFRHRVLDPAILYWRPLDDEKLPDSKTCYERAGLDSTVAHTAIEDALAVVRLVRQGIKRLKGT